MVKIDKLIYNFYGKAKGPEDLENKGNSWGTNTSRYQTDYEAIAIRMVWGGHKVRQTGLWNRDSRNRSRSPQCSEERQILCVTLKSKQKLALWGDGHGCGYHRPPGPIFLI